MDTTDSAQEPQVSARWERRKNFAGHKSAHLRMCMRTRVTIIWLP